jgi:uncharacterized protein (DUF433 family)
MSIADHPSWVRAVDHGISAMREAHADRGWYDSHDLINWLNEHYQGVLNEIIDSYRNREDGTPAQDPISIATQQIARFLQDHKGQVQVGKQASHRNVIQAEAPRGGGDSVVAVWQIGPATVLGKGDHLSNGPSASTETDVSRIEAGLIYDRGNGPEIRGTRITIYSLLPHMLDPTVTEDYICLVNQLTPEQVAAARAYILSNADTVLAQHLRIEERMAAGNSPEVIERAKESRATFLRFKEWLAKREKEAHHEPHAASTSEGEGRRSGLFPTFREWITQQESRSGESS